MITLMPFPDFALSLCCLDDKRLERQRMDALNIHKMIKGNHSGWTHRPECMMWYGYLPALAWYFNLANSYYKKRGLGIPLEDLYGGFPKIFPPWMGNTKLHLSHQSKLIGENGPHYRLWFGYQVPANLPYYWPKVSASKKDVNEHGNRTEMA